MEFSQSAIPEKRIESDNASVKKDLHDLRDPSLREGSLREGSLRQRSVGQGSQKVVPREGSGERSMEPSGGQVQMQPLQNKLQLQPLQNKLQLQPLQNKLQLQPLQNKLRMRVENYFGFIPEVYWQLCEHKHWKGKLQAVKFVRGRLDELQSKEQFMALLEMVSRIIVSKQATISAQCLEVLARMSEAKVQFSLQHLPFFVEEIIAEVLNFFSDTNRTLRQLALRCYLLLPQISFLSLGVLVRELVKHRLRAKHDPKLIITKL